MQRKQRDRSIHRGRWPSLRRTPGRWNSGTRTNGNSYGVTELRSHCGGRTTESLWPYYERACQRSQQRREGSGEHRGREGRGEHDGEGRGEHGGEGRGEHGGEGRGEHGGEGRGEQGGTGEESGKRLEKGQIWDETRNGAHLVLAYDENSQSFKGTLKNTSAETLSQVRVEVHLSGGVELGPTKRTNLGSGATIQVELSAAGHEFTWWTTHPEQGNEEGHGPGHEGGDDGGSGRPKDASLRPVYNQLQLLRREIRSISEELKSTRR